MAKKQKRENSPTPRFPAVRSSLRDRLTSQPGCAMAPRQDVFVWVAVPARRSHGAGLGAAGRPVCKMSCNGVKCGFPHVCTH